MRPRAGFSFEDRVTSNRLKGFFARLLPKMAPVEDEVAIGARFKMSPLGSARSPSLAGKEGIIVGSSRYYSSVRVQFDGIKYPMTLHRDYIELIPPKPR